MNTTATLSSRLLSRATFLLTRTNLNLYPTQGPHSNPSSLSGDEGHFSTSTLFRDEKEGLMWLCRWHSCQCLSEEDFMSPIFHFDSYLPYSHTIMIGSTIEHHQLASRTITHLKLSCFSAFILFPALTTFLYCNVPGYRWYNNCSVNSVSSNAGQHHWFAKFLLVVLMQK